MSVTRGREAAFFFSNYRIRVLRFLYGTLLSAYESKFLEVEVLSYNKPGQPPRPVSFRFMMGEEMFKGKVVKVKDMKLDNRMGNKIFEYLCDTVIEGNGSTVKIGYEKDSMKWYLKSL